MRPWRTWWRGVGAPAGTCTPVYPPAPAPARTERPATGCSHGAKPLLQLPSVALALGASDSPSSFSRPQLHSPRGLGGPSALYGLATEP